jgi:hypothetical protein
MIVDTHLSLEHALMSVEVADPSLLSYCNPKPLPPPRRLFFRFTHISLKCVRRVVSLSSQLHSCFFLTNAPSRVLRATRRR